MATKKKTETGSKSPSEAPSPEYVAFEELAKKIFKVPKTEIDKRDAEHRKRKQS